MSNFVSKFPNQAMRRFSGAASNLQFPSFFVYGMHRGENPFKPVFELTEKLSKDTYTHFLEMPKSATKKQAIDVLKQDIAWGKELLLEGGLAYPLIEKINTKARSKLIDPDNVKFSQLMLHIENLTFQEVLDVVEKNYNPGTPKNTDIDTLIASNILSMRYLNDLAEAYEKSPATAKIIHADTKRSGIGNSSTEMQRRDSFILNSIMENDGPFVGHFGSGHWRIAAAANLTLNREIHTYALVEPRFKDYSDRTPKGMIVVSDVEELCMHIGEKIENCNKGANIQKTAQSR